MIMNANIFILQREREGSFGKATDDIYLRMEEDLELYKILKIYLTTEKMYYTFE